MRLSVENAEMKKNMESNSHTFVMHNHVRILLTFSYLANGLDDRAKVVVGENNLGGLLAENINDGNKKKNMDANINMRIEKRQCFAFALKIQWQTPLNLARRMGCVTDWLL